MIRPDCYLCHLAVIIILISGCAALETRHYQLESYICRLLEIKYSDLRPWTDYPIIYEPINRGRLTIWSGVTTLPSSEFRCYTNDQNLSSIELSFANFAEKLEWTFYDLRKGSTVNGISINQRENTRYKISVAAAELYTNCNEVGKIELMDQNETLSDLKTICSECDQSTLSIVNGQIKELIKSKLNEHIIENLHWHLTEVISNQLSSGPISFKA